MQYNEILTMQYRTDCRPFILKILHEDFDKNDKYIEFLSLQRDFQFTLCCCNRPTLEVFYTENNETKGIYVGKVMNPCMPCNLGMELYDKDSILKYKLYARCCQLGLCCQYIPLQLCQFVQFDVLDSDGEPLSSKAIKVN